MWIVKRSYTVKSLLLRPPFGLPQSGLISEVVLISNTILYGKFPLGLAKTSLNSEVVFILDGL